MAELVERSPPPPNQTDDHKFGNRRHNILHQTEVPFHDVVESAQPKGCWSRYYGWVGEGDDSQAVGGCRPLEYGVEKSGRSRPGQNQQLTAGRCELVTIKMSSKSRRN